MEHIVAKLSQDFPDLIFCSSNHFYWSPGTKQIFYNKQLDGNKTAPWSLLHETAHALLEHKNYTSDIELLNIELHAWRKAIEISSNYNVSISKKYVHECLDSYRDWLHNRSTCPICGLSGTQKTGKPKYTCYNCHECWKVSDSRFKRCYREATINNSSLEIPNEELLISN